MKIKGNITKKDLECLLAESAGEIYRKLPGGLWTYRILNSLIWIASFFGTLVVLLYLLLLIPGVAGEGVIEGLLPLGILGLFLALLPLLVKLIRKSIRRCVAKVLLGYFPEGERFWEYEFGDNAFRLNDRGIVTEVPRDRILSIKEGSQGFFISLSNGKTAFLPQHFFSTPEEREFVRNYLN